MRGNVVGLLAVALICVFSLPCVTRDAVAGPIPTTVAYACADDGCDNPVVGETSRTTGGAGGAVASAGAEFYLNGVPGPVVANATALINDLSVNVDTRASSGANGTGTGEASFTDVLTMTGPLGTPEFFAAIFINLDPSFGGNAQLYWSIDADVFGPGTGCDVTTYLDCFSGVNGAVVGGSLPSALVLPLVAGDSVVLTAELQANANNGAYMIDPASVTISGLPPGIDILSAGGGTYTAGTVPEPATLALISIGLFGTGLGHRRKGQGGAV
jgi:hypothetical protein